VDRKRSNPRPGPTILAIPLRRVWLNAEQEQVTTTAFSNEGLWPLCHLADVRPSFRAGGLRAYEEVNAKFAETVAAEATNAAP